MKKTYIVPAMEVEQLSAAASILAGSVLVHEGDTFSVAYTDDEFGGEFK